MSKDIQDIRNFRTETILENMDSLKRLFDQKLINSKEEMKIFKMFLSDDPEIRVLAHSIVNEKLKFMTSNENIL